ncbi:hypothetical protein MHBO_002271 [Bonamia ostreae]|uniref:Lipocalin/cytosolic fatty-acid binding domain-containing protein n=1 Tax=Bonamia ostreae TaxID=126728 RepID=A0ABV2AMT1_9EUKA
MPAKISDLSTAKNVDLEKYQGQWYEIARIENYFEKRCGVGEMAPIAVYSLKQNNIFGVINSCRQVKNNKIKRVSGIAIVLDSPNNAIFHVNFVPIIKNFPSIIKFFVKTGNYWILKVIFRENNSYKYDLAYVCSPDRRCLWFLCRTSQVTEKEYDDFVEFSEKQKFDLTNLKRVR